MNDLLALVDCDLLRLKGFLIKGHAGPASRTLASS
jgi:hypothetical protein